MSVKDPRINACVLSGKVSVAYEERYSQSGDYANGKITMEVFNLSYDSATKKREYKPIPIEVKVIGKPEAKSSSPLGVMRELKVGDRIVVTGRFEADFWRPKDNPEKEYSKLYIQASAVQTFEAEDKPAPKPKPVEQTETEAGTTDDDLPF